jgi:hypothetical protein
MDKNALEAKLIRLNLERSALALKLADQYSPLLRTAGELCAHPHQISTTDVQMLHNLPTSAQIEAELRQFQALKSQIEDVVFQLNCG